MISRETIDAVYETARVEEVIGDFVQLKRAGSNFKGLSPFSDERTPSFMVSPAKQIWKDFSSSKGGNVVAFIMEHEHFSYPDAIKYLAKKYGIEIVETEQTDEQKEQASERESMYLVSEFANAFFQDQMHKTELGKAIGLSYFKERGFTDETIKKFQLGYSPDQWDAFTKAAIAKQYQLKYLEATGLTIVKEHKQFDRFKGRVMFPIHSMSGRVLGFGGRILTNDKKAAKYLNSPESDIYHKSKVLYGIYYAKQSIAKEDNCFLVEGYTDVIQFHQSGILNTVSSSGTALTSDQIRLINRLTQNITVLFDGDAAGLRAATRGIDLILEQGMNVRVCTFPEGDDPDSFAKKNSEESIKQYLLDNAQDFIRFKANLLQEEAKNDPIKKAELIRDMVGSIAKIADPIKREVYVKECAGIMDISENVLFATLAQLDAANKTQKRKEEKRALQRKGGQSSHSDSGSPLTAVQHDATTSKKIDPVFELENKVIEILLLYGNEEITYKDAVYKTNDEGEVIMEDEDVSAKVYEKIFLDLQMDEIRFMNPNLGDLYSVLINAYAEKGEGFKIELFLQELTPELIQTATHILMHDEKYKLDDWKRKEIHVKQKEMSVADYVSDVVLNLRRQLIYNLINDKMETIKVADETIDRMEVVSEIMDYQNLQAVLSKKLKRVVL